MPSDMKQIHLPVTPDQRTILLKLADKQKLTDYLRRLIIEDAARQGLEYPPLENQHGGKKKKQNSELPPDI